ncbi:MAG: DNA polymerase III subunit epsilon, partial [Halomonas sp.]
MARRLAGLPRRQRLIGLWLLLSGISLFGGATFALWLDTLFEPRGFARLVLWAGCFSGGGTIFLVGLLLERQLFTPLRHLQVQLARLVANPDARDDYPPEGWLRGLGPDLVRVREAWHSDRARLATAHAEGARSAARIRQELETLLQVLDTPLLLCDHHRRILLFNQAAETLFETNNGLGLGKRLEALLPASSLQDALSQLPTDGSPREVLVPSGERWLRAMLRRVPGSHGETLLTLTDTTAAWTSEMGARAELLDGLPRLRRHGASLTSAADALSALPEGESEMRRRLEGVIEEESQALGRDIERLAGLVERMQQEGARLVPLWSNDLWASLNERLPPVQRVTAVGMPAWFKGDAIALLVLLQSLLERLHETLGETPLEGEVCLGNKRVYLDLIWPGAPLTERQLGEWQQRHLASLPLNPRVADVLRQHASDAWSLADADGEHARLRLPLP